nr:translation initiation factor eIF 2B subunit [Hymenolepis microstoma]
MNDNNSEPPVKSKAQLRKERRAIQEAQRAKKEIEKAAKQAQKPTKPKDVNTEPKQSKKQNQNQKSAQSNQEKQGLRKPTDPSIKQQQQQNSKKVREGTSEVPQEDKKPAQTGSSQRWTLGVMRMDDPAHIKKSLRQLFKKKLPPRPFDPVRISYFQHLSQPDKRINVLDQHQCGAETMIHLNFQRHGFEIDSGRIKGSDLRCMEFVFATLMLIRDFDWSGVQAINGSIARAFQIHFDRHVTFLDQCRPLAVTVRGAVHCLKTALNRLDSLETQEDLALGLIDGLSTFVVDQIYKPTLVIAEHVNKIINDGSKICICDSSTVVLRSLITAWEKYRRRFAVCIVDSRPRCDGRKTLVKLSNLGIPCEFIPISALPAFASTVDLTLIGAHSLLTNGFAIGAIGTAHVANIIQAKVGSPVMVCAETYKFWDRAQSDAFEFNELADPDELWRGERALSEDWKKPKDPEYVVNPEDHPENWRDLSKREKDRKNLRLLNLTYDVIPPVLISAVITEMGVIPTTSVSVVLNSKLARNEANDGFSIPDFM